MVIPEGVAGVGSQSETVYGDKPNSSGAFIDGDADEDFGLLIGNLVSSEDAVVPTLRSALERGWSDRFGASLDQYLISKDAELKGLCNMHFGDFSEGISQVVELKAESAELRDVLKDMDARLQSAGAEVVQTNEQLLRFYRVQRHLDTAIEELQRAQNVVHLVETARAQMGNKAFYEALQTVGLVREVVQGEELRALEELRNSDESLEGEGRRHTYHGFSPPRKTRFALRLERWIPDAISKITVEVNNGLTEWFVEARRQAGPIGARALKMIANQQSSAIADGQQLLQKSGSSMGSACSNPMSSAGNKKKKIVTKGSVSSLRSRASSDLVLAWEHRDPSNTVDMAESCLERELSFAPLHQYLDIKSHLGELNSAVEFYKANRLPQADIAALAPGLAGKLDTLQPGDFLPLLDKITGFFLIETSVTRSLGLVAKSELAELWSATLEKVLPHLGRSFQQNVGTDAAPTLQVIQRVVHLAKLLGEDEACGENKVPLDTGPLLDMCSQERETIADVLISCGCGEITRIIKEENCEPWEENGMHAELEKQQVSSLFVELMGQLDVHAPSEDPSHGKHKFSVMVPRICQTVKQLTDQTFSLAMLLGGAHGLPVNDPGLLPKDRLKQRQKQQERDSQDPAFKSLFVKAAAASARVARICLQRLDSTIARATTSGSVEQLCQFSTNLHALQYLREPLQAYLQALALPKEADDVRAALPCAQSTPSSESSRTAKSAADDDHWWSVAHICDQLGQTSQLAQTGATNTVREKVEDLLAGADAVDWAPDQMEADDLEAHFFLSDTVQYLETTLNNAESPIKRMLSDQAVQSTHFACAGRVAETLLEVLCGDKVPYINAISVYTLRRDMQLLEQFAKNSTIPALEEFFTQLQQMVALLADADLSSYLDPSQRGRKYSYVSPNLLTRVLDKYQQPKVSTRILVANNKQLAIIKDQDIKKALQLIDN